MKMIKRFNQINEGVEDFQTNIEDYFIDFIDDNMLDIQIDKSGSIVDLFFNFNLLKLEKSTNELDLLIESNKYLQKIKVGIQRLKLEYPSSNIEYGSRISLESSDNYNYRIQIENLDTNNHNKFRITKEKYNELKERRSEIDDKVILKIYEILSNLGIDLWDITLYNNQRQIYSSKYGLSKKSLNSIEDEVNKLEFCAIFKDSWSNSNYGRIYIYFNGDDFLINEDYSMRKQFIHFYKVDKKSFNKFLKERYEDLVNLYKN